MSISNNIKLTINDRNAISQAIDHQLDSEFNQDVTLTGAEWNTIFDIVEQDQATNITDNSNPSFCELTQNAWNQIKNVVSNKLGKTTEQGNSALKETQNQEISAQNTETPEQAVTRILKEASIKVEPEILVQVIQKYPTMKAIPSANLTLEQRVINYANGLNFDKFGFEAAQASESGVFQSECSKAKSLDELKEAYKQFGAEFVEVYDQDNDGKINCYEMFYQELVANYVDNGFNKTEAKRKALEVVQQYTQYSVANMPTDESFESILFGNVICKIGMHETPNEYPDFAMSANEAGAHLMSMAKMSDDKNNITGEEYRFSQLAILYDGYTVQEIMLEGYSKEEANAIFNLSKKYTTNLPAYSKFLNN